MNRGLMYGGVGLITLSVLMLELSLTRLFSATMYHHFAFMAISLALFGTAASGVFVYVFLPVLKPELTGRWMSLAASLFATTTVFAVHVVLNNTLSYELDAENYYRLVRIYCATSLPFFFAGCAVTLAITRTAADFSRLYVYDLAGAALGCLLLIPVLDAVGAINAVLLVAALAAFAGVLFSRLPGTGRTVQVGSFALFACLAFVVGSNCTTHAIDIRESKGFIERDVLFAKWNSFSRITVVGDLASTVDIKIDADAVTHISKDASDSTQHQEVRDSVSALAHLLKRDASVLIIGAGGGDDVVAARVFGQRRITAVEINPIIARDVMSSEPFKSYAGAIFQQPEVQLVVDEGRSFVRRSPERYDLIQATMVDTWAATAAGAFALSENHLYTVEAFVDFVAHLNDDGVLTMTRWYFEPPDQLLRVLTLTRAMMSELGISNPGRHVMLVRDARSGSERTPATYLFKKSEFSDAEVRAVETEAHVRGFEILFTPLTRPANVFTRMLEASDPVEVWNGYESNVEPTWDDNPFFFNSLRPSRIRDAMRGTTGEWQKTNLGTSILFALLKLTGVLVAVFVLGPLVLVRRRALATGVGAKLAHLAYFGCLGAGFIIVEVAMIQKFILFLGHPVYALAVVLFAMLAFSALGSHLSARVGNTGSSAPLQRVLAGLVALVFVYVLVLPPIFYGWVHLASGLRIAIAVVLLGPLATVMGMPMPIGIRRLAGSAGELIPWAWGVNGATSVMGSVAALVIAIFFGFNAALLCGAALYLVAMALVAWGPRTA